VGALPNLKFKKYFELAVPTNPGKKPDWLKKSQSKNFRKNPSNHTPLIA